MAELIIREEVEDDIGDIFSVTEAAYGRSEEAVLVEGLRENPAYDDAISLVALVNGKISGHALFFPVTIRSEKGDYGSLALVPVSVRPEWQRRGIAGKMILVGIKLAKERGFSSVVVMGDHKYYPRFGFKRASMFDVKAPFDIPEESYMAMELEENALVRGGTVEYPPEFEEL